MDNSAFRLLRLLEKAKGHPDTTPSVRVWKSVFELANDADVPGRFGQLLVLAETAASDILEIDSSCSDAVSYWKGQILNAMSATTLHSPWKDFSKFIDTHTLQYLNLQARLLNASHTTFQLDREKLGRARDSLWEALESIRESDLPLPAKQILIKRISELISAIDDYVITGQEGVFDAFKLAAVDLRDELAAHPDIAGKSKLREGLSIIADLMTVATATAALSGPALKLLELVK